MISETSHQGQIQKILVEGDNFLAPPPQKSDAFGCFVVHFRDILSTVFFCYPPFKFQILNASYRGVSMISENGKLNLIMPTCVTARTKSYVLLGGLGDEVPQKTAPILILNKIQNSFKIVRIWLKLIPWQFLLARISVTGWKGPGGHSRMALFLNAPLGSYMRVCHKFWLYFGGFLRFCAPFWVLRQKI